jgi:glutathione S-transferase
MNNTVHPTFTHIFMPQKYSDQADVQAALKTYNTQVYKGLLAEIEALVVRQLSPSGWLSGERLGPSDAYALTLTRWGSIAGIDPQRIQACGHMSTALPPIHGWRKSLNASVCN